MAGVFERTAVAVRSLLLNARSGVREERVVRYVLNEMRKGRPFDEVICEPYVLNHSTPPMRARLVENPRIVEGIEDQLAGQRYTYTVDYAMVKRLERRD